MNSTNIIELENAWKKVLFDKDGLNYLEKCFHHNKHRIPTDYKDHVHLVRAWNKAFKREILPENLEYGKTFFKLRGALANIDVNNNKDFIKWTIKLFQKNVGGKTGNLYFREGKFAKVKSLYKIVNNFKE